MFNVAFKVAMIDTDTLAYMWLSQNMWALYSKLKVKFTLEQAMKAQRGRRGIALLFL
jgi:hypothetical protein